MSWMRRLSVSYTHLDVYKRQEVESSLTLLETELPGDHPKLAHQKLWVDAYTAAPVKMEITDKSGNPSIVILYQNFQMNPQLEDSLFSTED